MHRFDGLDIELTRGDSLQLKVFIRGRTFPDGTLALFTVKRRTKDETPAIEKKIPIEPDGSVQIGLSHADSDITPATYFWDLRVLIPLGDGTYEVRTPMEYAAFSILEVVGDV